MRYCGPQSRSGSFEVEKNLLALPEFETQNIQPTARRYIDCAVQVLHIFESSMLK